MLFRAKHVLNTNSNKKATKSKAKAKNGNLGWTDDEVELLLNVVIE